MNRRTSRKNILMLLAAAASLAWAAFGKVPVNVAAASQAAPPQGPAARGAEVYANQCAMCHGVHREGNPPMFPSLIGVSSRKTQAQVTAIIHNGNGAMPALPSIEGDDLNSLLAFLFADAKPPESGPPASAPPAHAQSPAEAGRELFQTNCAFCHGREATGAEGGPDLTRSTLVANDVGGNKISEVVRLGRNGDRKMPAFNFSELDLQDLAAFIHYAEAAAKKRPGGRAGVDDSDFQTGNVEAGRRYFNGPGKCASCHSATADLAGVARRYHGLELEERILYPRRATSKVVVTLASGERISGTLAYKDEFVLGIRDSSGTYRSWRVGDIRYTIDSPAQAHVDLLPQYTDDDIHNLMAYIQTLR